MDNKKTTFFGLTSFRNQRKKFGIKQDDRRRHFYTIGKTGMGKSNLMENMAIQDIQNGNGIAYVDPHGEGAEKLLDFIPAERIKDVVFLNPADLDFPIAFNVMEKVDFRYRHLVAGGLMAVFKKVWPDVWSARMEYILNNTILALLEYPNSTLLGVNRMLADPEYRKEVVSNISDPTVKAFWVTEYARYSQKYETEATAAIQNKVGQFMSNALIRNIVGQTKSTINMRNIMDEGKILILDLSKGRIGEDNSRLLGALLITKIQLAAMSRVDIPESDREDFYLYVDEFQNFATESFASILSEARKYRLNLIVGHQYITQMDEIVRDAVFGNVGTLAVFRVGAEDADFLEKEFEPEFMATDLVNLSKYNIYLKLMIDGVASHPFSAETLAPPIPLEQSNRNKIIQASRDTYGVKREIVEEKIKTWTESTQNQTVPKMQPLPLSGFGQGQEKTFSTPNKLNNPVSVSQTFEQTVLHDATCSVCGKPTKTIFEPKAGRPVYCKSCLKKIKNLPKKENFPKNIVSSPKPAAESIFAKSSSVVMQDEPLKIENIPFHSQKKSPLPVPPRRDGVGARKAENDQPMQTGKSNPSQIVYQEQNSAQGRQINSQSGNSRPGTKRKEINLSELKKVLEESLVKKESFNLAQNEKNKKKEVKNIGVEKEDSPIEDDNTKKGLINPGEKVKL